MAKSLEFLELDFYDPQDAIIALTFSSADFRDIGGNKGTYSKTLKMPATKVNDTFFGMSFEATSEGLFDPKIKLPIQISEIEFYGTLQLKSVETLNNQSRNYVVTIFGDLADWVSLIGEKSVRDLSVWRGVTTPQSHILNKETISATWDKNGLTGSYVYPLISYGNFLQDVTATDNIDVAFWRPAFFVLPIIKNIFKDVGYTFIDTGIVKTPLRDTILPFTSKEVNIDTLEVLSSYITSDENKDAVIEALNTGNIIPIAQFDALGSVMTKITKINESSSSFPSYVNIKFNTEEKDAGNLFSSEGQYVAPSNDAYDITINIPEIYIGGSDTGQFGEKDPSGVVSVELISDNRRVQVIQPVAYARGGNTISLYGNISTDLSSGEVCIIVLKILNFPKTAVAAIILDASISIKPRFTTLNNGDLLTHSEVVQNVKQIDVLKDIIRYGNFRIVTNNQRKTVELIQESEFLTTTGESWDGKVDESKPSSIALIQNQGAKELEWGYSNDSSDGFIIDREKRKDKEFAQERMSLDSEHRRGNLQVHKSIFSSTIDGRGLGLGMPVMSTQELKQGEATEQGSFETGFENRILIYDGLRQGNFIIDNVAKTQYPYCYFKSNDFSLKWDSNDSFTTQSGLTQLSFETGLVDRYYVDAINRLNNSKLYTGWFFLSNLDIQNLDFRKPKIINGIHYYLNKVIDYKLNINESTKVELISR